MIWQIEAHKWQQLRDLGRRVTAMIACSVGGHRQLAKKLDAFLLSLDETKENLELQFTTILRRLGLDRNLAGAATARSACNALVCSSWHSE